MIGGALCLIKWFNVIVFRFVVRLIGALCGRCQATRWLGSCPRALGCRRVVTAALVLALGWGPGAVFAFQEAPVTALAFAPDGQALCRGSNQGLVVLSWPERQVVRRLATELAVVLDLRFSPQGDCLLVGGGIPGEAGQVELWSWPAGELLQRLQPHVDVIQRVAWAPGGERFGVASFTGECSVHDWLAADDPAGERRATERQRFVGHAQAVLAIEFWDDGSCVSAGLDQSLRWWNVGDGVVKRSLTNHVGAVVGVLPERAWSHSEVPERTVPERGRPPRRLWSVGADRTVRLWQPEVGRMVRFARLPETPTVACWDAGVEWIYVGGRDGRVWRVAAETMEVAEVGQWGQEQGVAAVAVHPGDGTLVVGGAFGLQVVDAPE